MGRSVAVRVAGILAVAFLTGNASAVYLTQDQTFTVNAPGYWQALFYEYTYSTTTTRPVQFQQADVASPWLLYNSWFGLFLYDYSTMQFEEALYYSNDRL